MVGEKWHVCLSDEDKGFVHFCNEHWEYVTFGTRCSNEIIAPSHFLWISTLNLPVPSTP